MARQNKRIKHAYRFMKCKKNAAIYEYTHCQEKLPVMPSLSRSLRERCLEGPAPVNVAIVTTTQLLCWRRTAHTKTKKPEGFAPETPATHQWPPSLDRGHLTLHQPPCYILVPPSLLTAYLLFISHTQTQIGI